ncbi:MAG: hypothetical protein M3N41_11235 [Acidobacteriota bacterium]|nr:hypothetical protein [Acidobacteriota bacterium]
MTLRLLALVNGGNPMRAIFDWPVGVSEVTHASLACDIGLIAMACGWLLAQHVAHRFAKSPQQIPRPVSMRRMKVVAVICFAIGVVGLIFTGRNEAVLNGSWRTSGYMAATSSWMSFSLLLLHYVYGFPRRLVLASSIVLVVTGISISARAAVVIPIFFLLLLMLTRRRSRSIPLIVFPAVAGVLLIWLPMKPLTFALHSGVAPAEAVAFAVDSTVENFSSQESSIDQQFLDMIGATMTLADLRGEWYWGGTIAPLFVAPVPRILWPAKPKLNQFQVDLDVPSRSIAKIGMTPGLVGEAYVNMGLAGVFLTCGLVSFGFTWAYFRVAPPSVTAPGLLRSPGLFLYLLFLSCSMQTYRDGLISLIWFPFVYAAPAGLVAVSHWIWKCRTRTLDDFSRTRSQRTGNFSLSMAGRIP